MRQTGTGKGEERRVLQDGLTLPPSPFPLPPQGRLLAIDWGTKRIGLAISDEAQTIALPLEVLTRRSGRRFPMKRLRRLLENHHPVGVVVGLPLTPGGVEGPAAMAVREAGTRIEEKTGLPVVFWDERFTTARARGAVSEMGGDARGRPGDVDPLAATVLLQSFLDARSRR